MSAIKEIKKRLKDSGKPGVAQELDLSEINISKITPEIKKQLDAYTAVETLLLHQCQLESLDNLPAHWKLKAVDLSNNKLDNDAIKKLATYTELVQIILVANQISTLEALQPLYELKNLQEVDLSQNPVAEVADFASTLFSNITSLEVLNRKDKDGKEVEEEQFVDDEQDYDDDDDEEQYDEDEDDDEYEEEEESSDRGKKKRK